MSNSNKMNYIKEFNKEHYKVLKVYIPVDEYDRILEHSKNQGHKAMSGYVKALIDADMKKNISAEE